MTTPEQVAPLQIRAHTLLCLQGYKGLGYSPEFIRKMDEVTDLLRSKPETEVQVICAPDVFCAVCPNLDGNHCVADELKNTGKVIGTPDESTLMDYLVLKKLGFRENEIHRWSAILETIGRNVSSSDMDLLCGGCRWREYPYCANALDALSKTWTYRLNQGN
jgi:hypothetical protein